MSRSITALSGLALALLTWSGASRADMSWVRIGHAQDPSAAYAENFNGMDLSAQALQSMARVCFINCPLAELRSRARYNPTGLGSAHAHNTMLYALTQANGQPLTPGELFALGSIVLRFKITGQHGLPPLGSVAFTYSALVLPFTHVSPAGRTYDGRNERTATGLAGQSTLTQYKLDKAKPRITVSNQQAEINGTRFAIEVPTEASGSLEWHIADQVDGNGAASADYRIVLAEVNYTGAGVPGAGLRLGEGGSSWYRLTPNQPGGGD